VLLVATLFLAIIGLFTGGGASSAEDVKILKKRLDELSDHIATLEGDEGDADYYDEAGNKLSAEQVVELRAQGLI
jgi:hypothetical protein